MRLAVSLTLFDSLKVHLPRHSSVKAISTDFAVDNDFLHVDAKVPS